MRVNLNGRLKRIEEQVKPAPEPPIDPDAPTRFADDDHRAHAIALFLRHFPDDWRAGRIRALLDVARQRQAEAE